MWNAFIWTGAKILNDITAALLFLFIIFLFTQHSRKKHSNRFLALFLLSLLISLFSFILYQFINDLYLKFPQIFWISNSFAFLWGPSLYFYARSLASKDFTLKKKYLLHLIPFAVYWLYKSIEFYGFQVEPKVEMLLVGKIFILKDIFIIGSLLHIPLLCYLTAVVKILKKHRTEIKRVYSSIESVNLSWLQLILTGFGVIWLGALTNLLIAIKTGHPNLNLSMLNILCVFLVSNFTVFKGLSQPEIFSDNNNNNKRKYEKSTLSRADAERYLEQLKAYMQSEKPYLEPALTLNDLAEALSIQPRHLSQIINESLDQNFFEFINSYRVDEAKELLADPTDEGKSILDILYDAGFNSKASFNLVFKKTTGMTPSEFRKQCRA